MGKTVSFSYNDIDTSGMSKDELEALGIEAEEEELEEEEEETEEEEEESEEEETEKEELEEEEEKKEPRIPKSRFDEAVQKEREQRIRLEEKTKYLEEQILRLEALATKVVVKEEVVEEYDFDIAESKYAELLISGEVDEATKLRREINKQRDNQIKSLIKNIKSEAEEAVKTTTRNLSERDKKAIIIEEAIVKYPFLNSDHADFNEGLVKRINYVSAGYETEGKTPSQALKLAIEDLVPKTIKSTSEAKKKEKVVAMSKQPPKTDTTKRIKSKELTDYDWEEMSQEDFRKLYKESPDLVNKYLRRVNP